MTAELCQPGMAGDDAVELIPVDDQETAAVAGLVDNLFEDLDVAKWVPA